MSTARNEGRPKAEELARRLARRGFRLTPQRKVVLEAIRAAGGHPTAHEIYERARRRLPRISLGTVYRTLGVLRDAGLVQELHFGKSEGRYEEQHDEHHHAVCTACGRIQDVPSNLFGDFVDQARRATDFEIVEHKLEFLGLCSDCRVAR